MANLSQSHTVTVGISTSFQKHAAVSCLADGLLLVGLWSVDFPKGKELCSLSQNFRSLQNHATTDTINCGKYFLTVSTMLAGSSKQLAFNDVSV